MGSFGRCAVKIRPMQDFRYCPLSNAMNDSAELRLYLNKKKEWENVSSSHGLVQTHLELALCFCSSHTTMSVLTQLGFFSVWAEILQ